MSKKLYIFFVYLLSCVHTLSQMFKIRELFNFIRGNGAFHLVSCHYIFRGNTSQSGERKSKTWHNVNKTSINHPVCDYFCLSQSDRFLCAIKQRNKQIPWSHDASRHDQTVFCFCCFERETSSGRNYLLFLNTYFVTYEEYPPENSPMCT